MYLGATLLALVAVLVRMAFGRPDLLRWYLVAWGLFVVALWLARSVPARQRAVLVVAGGVIVTATGLVAPPSTSTDSYRYAWDGRVQAAGICPMTILRRSGAEPVADGWLFPDDCDAPDRARVSEGVCTRINRPAVHTIYPPLAEGYFLLLHWLTPEGSRHKGLQVGGALMAIAVLLALCRRAGAGRAAYWAWCPAVPPRR